MKDNKGQISVNLLPHYHYKKIEDITVEDIKSWGVKGVAIDIDNTICYDATKKFIGNSRQWVEYIIKSGIPIMIVSNANALRAVKIGKMLGIPCIPLAKKPSPQPFMKAADILGLDIKEIAFIGDQIFSDIKGANDVGAVSVYVEPPAREIVFYFFYRYRRFREKPVIKRMFEIEKGNKVRERNPRQSGV